MRGYNVMEVPLFLLVLELYFIVAGDAVHPGCECLIFSATYGKEKGTFKSPDFPRAYPTNIDCLLYTFIGSPDEIIELTFLDFDVRKTHLDCIRADYVKLFLHLEGGEVNEYTPWAALLCGGLADIPNVLYSSGPGLVLEFHSGSRSTNATGFSGTFRFIDKLSLVSGEDPPTLYLTTETENVTLDFKSNVDKVNPLHPIKFIIHGYSENANLSHYMDMARAYLIRGAYNIIRVDYSHLAQVNYIRAVFAVENLGKYVGEFIVKLHRKLGIPLSGVHIIGHSMGAQVAGYAGKAVFALVGGRIARITGLDPARPIFEGRSEDGRLDKGDAVSVEIVHTDKGIFGYRDSMGTVDFYPNGGGRLQLGCKAVPHFVLDLIAQKDNWGQLQPADNYCSHQRSISYFTESINSEIAARKCNSWSEYVEGICGNNEKILFGENTPFGAKGDYYLSIVVNKYNKMLDCYRNIDLNEI